jgi:HSP20 family protein
VETGWTDDHLNLRFVLPGVSAGDLDVTVQGNQLILKGERKIPEGFGKEGAVHFRLPYGQFQRILDLPHGLETDKMEAHLHDGVLDLRIPVAAEVKPKKVSISIATGDEKKSIAA